MFTNEQKNRLEENLQSVLCVNEISNSCLEVSFGAKEDKSIIHVMFQVRYKTLSRGDSFVSFSEATISRLLDYLNISCYSISGVHISLGQSTVMIDAFIHHEAPKE